MRKVRIAGKNCLGIAVGFAFLLFALPMAGSGRPSSRASAPDFGPNVFIFDPATPAAEIQSRIDAIAKEQQLAHFGTGRYAIFLKPGAYNLEAKVAFYTQLAGLGLLPDDVTIHGHVQSLSMNGGFSVLVSFWRSVENMAVQPPDGVDHWAVSQAAPLPAHARDRQFIVV